MASALVIAGWDPTGGAGIAADLRAFQALNIVPHGLLSCVTSQSHSQFFEMAPPGISLGKALVQIPDDVRVLKTGWIPESTDWSVISNWVSQNEVSWFCDPVLGPTSKGFHNQAPLDAIRCALPQMTLISPNLKEAQAICKSENPNGMELAKRLVQLGAKAALVTGGDAKSELSQDAFWSATHQFSLENSMLPGSFRGTGCTLTSLVSAHFLGGSFLEDAVVLAKGQLYQGLKYAMDLPEKQVVSQIPHEFDLPKTSPCDADPFPAMDRSIGFYPIFDRFEWFEKIAPHFPPTVQIRIKDLSGSDLNHELARCISFCKEHDIRCFVNDYWEMAMELGAFGVHLGQEDLDEADFVAIQQAGLRLGISTHSEWELVRAIAFQPSYVALGPVFPTQLKKMRHGPQGIERLSRWVSWSSIPVVGIGGITLETAPQVWESKCDGLAVVSAITGQKDPQKAMQTWLHLQPSRN